MNCDHMTFDKKHLTFTAQDTWVEKDAQGIYLARVCDLCVDAVLSKYRPEILTGYTQADVDEPIDEE